MPNVYAPYSTVNTAGVNIEESYPPAATAPYSAPPPFALGQVVEGTDEGKWVFCVAAAALALGDVFAINPSTFSASLIVNGSTTPSLVGVAPIAVPNGESFWGQVNGYAPAIRASAASTVTATDGNLHTTATPGAISSTITASTTKTIVGIAWTTAPSGAGTFPGVLDSPMITKTD